MHSKAHNLHYRYVFKAEAQKAKETEEVLIHKRKQVAPLFGETREDKGKRDGGTTAMF